MSPEERSKADNEHDDILDQLIFTDYETSEELEKIFEWTDRHFMTVHYLSNGVFYVEGEQDVLLFKMAWE